MTLPYYSTFLDKYYVFWNSRDSEILEVKKFSAGSTLFDRSLQHTVIVDKPKQKAEPLPNISNLFYQKWNEAEEGR